MSSSTNSMNLIWEKSFVSNIIKKKYQIKKINSWDPLLLNKTEIKNKLNIYVK